MVRPVTQAVGRRRRQSGDVGAGFVVIQIALLETGSFWVPWLQAIARSCAAIIAVRPALEACCAEARTK